MGNKSALSWSNLNKKSQNNSNPDMGTPFWSVHKTKGSTIRKMVKFGWKWLKILFFCFFMLMGLWGCFQSMWDPTISQNTLVGNGLEFAFPFGTTGDYRFDAQSTWNANQYTTFTNWSMQYGPFYGLFVWPGSAAVHNFMWITNTWWGGLSAFTALFLLLLVIRLLSLAITIKSSFQSERMVEIQGKMAEINAKYKNLKDMASKKLKQQEAMALYSKYKIKPFAAFEQMFLTMPIFLIVYRVVTIVRPMKAAVLFNIWGFAESPLNQIFSNFANMGWTYIFLLAIIMATQFFSMKLPQMWAKKRNRQATAVSAQGDKQMKKTRMTQTIFIVVMCVIVSFSAVGVGIYWFLNSLFTILQAWIIHKLIINKRKKSRTASAQKLSFSFE